MYCDMQTKWVLTCIGVIKDGLSQGIRMERAAAWAQRDCRK